MKSKGSGRILRQEQLIASCIWFAHVRDNGHGFLVYSQICIYSDELTVDNWYKDSGL